MRVLHVCLLIYFLLIAGASLVLWNAGVVQRVPVSWAITGVSGAMLPGVLLAVLSQSPRPARHE